MKPKMMTSCQRRYLMLNLVLRLKLRNLLAKKKIRNPSIKVIDFQNKFSTSMIYGNQAGLDHTVSLIMYWTKI